MKKLFCLFVFILIFTFSTAYASEFLGVHTYSFNEIISYDDAKIKAEQIDDKDVGTFSYLVYLLGGEEIAKKVNLGVTILDNGRLAIRHSIEQGGYKYHLKTSDFTYLYSEIDNGIHFVLSMDLIREICTECTFAQ